jgi:hypothetical protein
MKWYISVSGYSYEAYQCDVEGQKIFLDDDPIYNQRTYDGRHLVSGLITFHCK